MLPHNPPHLLSRRQGSLLAQNHVWGVRRLSCLLIALDPELPHICQGQHFLFAIGCSQCFFLAVSGTTCEETFSFTNFNLLSLTLSESIFIPACEKKETARSLMLVFMSLEILGSKFVLVMYAKHKDLLRWLMEPFLWPSLGMTASTKLPRLHRQPPLSCWATLRPALLTQLRSYSAWSPQQIHTKWKASSQPYLLAQTESMLWSPSSVTCKHLILNYFLFTER